MKFNAQKLWFALDWCKRCINDDGILPELQYIYVSTENKMVSVVGSNLETTCHIRYPIESDEKTSFMIDKRIVRLIKKETEVEFVSNEVNLTCITGSKRISFDLSGVDPDTHIGLTKPTESFDYIFDVGRNFYNNLKAVMKFTTTDFLRPAMTGINISRSDSEIILAASDGHKLINRWMDAGVEGEFDFILTKKFCSIISLLKNVDQTYVSKTSSHVKFKTQWSDYRIEFITKTIGATYPNFNAVIPRHTASFSINKKDFIRELVDCMDWINPTTRQIKIRLNENVFFGENEWTMAHYESTIKIDNESEINEIAFNARFLLEIIRECKNDVLKFYCDEKLANKPVYLKDENGLLLIMPIVIY